MEIQDYPDYLIYPDGKVQNKKTKRYLKPAITHKGYQQVCLWKDGKKGKTLKIHRLVAIHYIPNPNNEKEVDHINCDKTDNRVVNLRWIDRIGNLKNQRVRKNNKIGIKNISYHKQKKNYQFKKDINGKCYLRYFETLTEALCYKFIFILKSTI